MNLRKLSIGLLFAASMSLTVVSCKPKDQNVKASVVTAVANNTIMVDVTDGVATLSGTVANDAQKAELEAKAKAVKGVKSVNNNIQVDTPKVDPDAVLTTQVQDALKDYKTVVVSVSGGRVYLSGEATKEDMTKVIQIVNGMNIKDFDNKITVKK